VGTKQVKYKKQIIPVLREATVNQTGLVRALFLFLLAAVFLLPAAAQTAGSTGPNDALNPALQDLKEQVKELREAVAEIRAEAARYRAETTELRQEVEALRREPASSFAATESASTQQPAAPKTVTVATSQTALDQRVQSLEEQGQLLTSKVDEQYQTKVESASKYRVRLSGIALLNVFSNRNTFDSQDLPNYVLYPNPVLPKGSFGASLRQSQIGLEVFGPHLLGARTTGDIQADFAGGFPDSPNGSASGLMRLRTATLRMDWKNTSLVGGQDTILMSPLSPTSYASLALPAFAYAGNLWSWLPQVRVEHRFTFAEDKNLELQAGILDNLTGEPFPSYQSANIPQAGERSSQPAYATRLAWTQHGLGSPMTIGIGGYYSRQDWWFNRHVDGWAATADWRIPLGHGFGLSGEFYRGRGIGGLGGGFGRSVLYNGDLINPATQVLGLNAVGGWSQLKFKANEKLEFNGAFGMDNSYAHDLKAFYNSQSYLDPTLFQNRNYLANVIYRPHTNLILSAEYRFLRTIAIDDDTVRDGHQVNLVMGILF
jgi:hypothetical protein